ncbi:hypothetical protein GCM10027399_12880 [Curvibacter fontanus]
MTATGIYAPSWTRRDQYTLWFYRVGGYVLLNVLDEPAWLALIFC